MVEQYQSTKLMAAENIRPCHSQPTSDIEPGWVRLRLAVAGICGTDMHYYKHFGNAGYALERPISLGHEACAYVMDANGEDFQTGALVALNPIIECGHCDFCKAGEENLCTSKKFPGSALTKPHIDGFFQEVFDFPASSCHLVSSDVKPDHLAFTEPLACSLHAVHQAKIEKGHSVLVMGCGPMGLLSIVAAHSKGAHVTCVDLRPGPAAKGREIGAETSIILREGGVIPECEYDAVIEASGSSRALNSAFDAVKKGGVISILSNLSVEAVYPDLHKIMLKEISMVGAFQFNREFKEALLLIESNEYDFGCLVSQKFPLRDISQAFELVSNGTIGKVQLIPA